LKKGGDDSAPARKDSTFEVSDKKGYYVYDEDYIVEEKNLVGDRWFEQPSMPIKLGKETEPDSQHYLSEPKND